MTYVGIDLGTTNSVVAVFERGETRILQIAGKATVPSVVYRHGDKHEVGVRAKQRTFIDPERTLSSTKRHIGSNWSKKVDGKKYRARDAAYEILAYLKRETEALLGEPVRDAVITVPAYFDDDQRRDTKDAAERAGFNVLRLLPEPTAAAIAYGLDKEKNQTILVFDLGGGTFDVSILEVQGNAFTVKAVDGNSKLGGDDFDLALVDWLNQRLEEQAGRSLRGDKVVQQKLKETAEEAKISLSSAKRTEMSIAGLQPGLDLEIDRFTRAEYEALIQPFVDEMIVRTDAVIDQAGMDTDDLGRIVLVGGSCKTPLVAQEVARRYREPFLADDMDTYVARGAAIVCAQLAGEASGKRVLPVDLDFKDVVSHTLGTQMVNAETSRDMYVPILKKNTIYPTRAAVLGYTRYPNQKKVTMEVLRGEDANPKNNALLGEITMDITRKWVGQGNVPVSSIFELDNDGILHFTAVEIGLEAALADDIAVLSDEAGRNHQVVPLDLLDALIERHRLQTKKITIQAALNR